MKLAAIDIGTNSIHMVHMSVAPDGGLSVVGREKEAVRLGLGLFSSGKLTERAFFEGLQTIDRYVRLSQNAGADEILAVATSATRDARNGKDFLREIQKNSGLRPRVIAGTTEAGLIFKAVLNALPVGSESVLVLDIGGGSAEIAVGNSATLRLTESLRLGVQRLVEQQPDDGPLSKKQLQRLRERIREAAEPHLEVAKQMGVQRMIGTSGTIRHLAEAAERFAGGAPWEVENAQEVSLEKLERLSAKLLHSTVKERLEIPGITGYRAENIHLGSVVVVEFLKMLELDQIIVCDASLREGVIIDYLERHGRFYALSADLDVRERAVQELARRYDRKDPYDEHVTKMALQLFDATAALHHMDSTSRDLLEYAGKLHGIGRYISFAKRHKHTFCLIAHSKPRGFSGEEMKLIANVARYHRRSKPKKKHKSYKALAKAQRAEVRLLAAVLRVAVGLDRGQIQTVKRLRVEKKKKKELEVILESSGECGLELWASDRRKEPLEKELGYSILFRAERRRQP